MSLESGRRKAAFQCTAMQFRSATVSEPQPVVSPASIVARAHPRRARREDRQTIPELSSLRRPTKQLIERRNCRGHAAEGWALAAADCLSRQARRSSRLTSRNLGEPVNNRPFTLLLGSTRVENLSRSCRAARWSREKFDAIAEASQFADHLARSHLLRLRADGRARVLRSARARAGSSRSIDTAGG